MQPGLAELVDATAAAYGRVHREAFLGDPVANSRLPVEVVSADLAGSWPALVLLTPWTCNGLLFVDAEADVPTFLDVAGSRRPVFTITMPDLPRHASVNLVGDVSRWTSPEQARTVARSFAAPFFAGVQVAMAGSE